MDSQSAETSDSSSCLAALAHFLDRIDQDTKEWYYAVAAAAGLIRGQLEEVAMKKMTILMMI
eukprot:CAMPEP_0172416428 /NCGR_PEP_ID=MMETSP1064-20121228/2905_1 /TAXON_ID=202472 /ORGANISM="Aulacoseira subarctica , Strain CCAP 1002/5" /LENGTH=61 /DNA_ID=CAMNT_0013154065 /DNA_START=158 /DNA_END=340 /DNA_ORIENTATION=-